MKRDELGVIYQLCVAPEAQRGLIGAALVREVFARSAYGCRLYCCWCAQDLEANRFWEAMGFVPIAFRAGSSKKSRVHIFWQKRIVEGDTETKWWYPSQTNQGAIREDRIVFPIPPGTHWSEVHAVHLAAPLAGREGREGHEQKRLASEAAKRQTKPPKPAKAPLRAALCGLRFGPSPTAPEAAKEKAKRVARPKVKHDPKFLAAARELRDRWMEQVNSGQYLPQARDKYDVARQLAVAPSPLKQTPLLKAA